MSWKLIDADSLIDAIDDIPTSVSCYGTVSEAKAVCQYAKMVKGLIKDTPLIEAEPVRHAHWNGWTATHWTKKCDDYGDPIFKEHTYYQCSKCRRRTVIKSAYCPACGCKMDEVSE